MKLLHLFIIALLGGTTTTATAFYRLGTTMPTIDTLKAPDIEQEAERDRINAIPLSSSTLDNSARKSRGDKAFRSLGYMKSVELYQDVQQKEGSVTVVMMKHLAEAYRLNSELQRAEYWYARLLQQTEEAIQMLRYAQVLQSNGKCEDAARWYEKYAAATGKKATESFDCNLAETLAANRSLQIQPLYQLNSPYLDFSPIPYRGGLVFTSTRPHDQQIVRRDAWTQTAFSGLWQARKNGQQWEEPVVFAPELSSRFHNGTATFSGDGRTMVFSRSNPDGHNENGIVELQLFISQQEAERWSKPMPLPFNSDTYNVCHPSLSADGRTLFFASDMPGSFGGMDIFMVRMEGKTWSAPINLGPVVNTDQNELFPFIGTDNVLYFSSNGHRGLGGLDIFKVEKEAESDDYSWQNRTNLGQRINSKKDDFGYVLDENGGGYFTSNRRGGTGKDDLYRWTQTTEELSHQRIIIVDDATGESIAAAAVKVVRRKNDVQLGTDDFFSDKAGQFILPTRQEEQYVITASKAPYQQQEQSISAAALMLNDYYELRLRRPQLTLRGQVQSRETQQNITASTVTLFNKCTNKSLNVTSDIMGKFVFALDCNCDYELRANKGGFEPLQLNLSSSDLDCGTESFIDKIILLYPEEPETQVVETPPSPKRTFKKGDVIVLENLYYDFNKYEIRNDASVELDKVVRLLRRYPSMKLSLRSHTDARGANYYNQWLSRKRAEKAVEYIISKGIMGDRVRARGFGETLLTNECADGVECSEEEHQANRRTEIKILELNENVQVQYFDN